MITKLLVATTNIGKLKELKKYLGSLNIELVSLNDLPEAKAPEENGKDYIENANIKAEYYAKCYNMHILADDSGFEIDALDKFPGLNSAPFAIECGGYPEAFAKIEEMMKGKENKTARFVCTLALFNIETGKIEHFHGSIEGKLSFPPSGSGGFGYEPIFIPDGWSITLSEIKGRELPINHSRFNAAMKLKEFLENQ